MSSPTGFPDLELLLSMEPEELAGKLLSVARRLTSENSMKMVAMGNLNKLAVHHPARRDNRVSA